VISALSESLAPQLIDALKTMAKARTPEPQEKKEEP